MMRKSFVAVLPALVLAAACSQGSEPDIGPGPLSAQEIRDHFVGHTYASSSGAKGAYNEDGTATFESQSESDTGTWRIEGDSLCITWNRLAGGHENCFGLTLLEDGRIEVSNGSILTRE